MNKDAIKQQLTTAYIQMLEHGHTEQSLRESYEFACATDVFQTLNADGEMLEFMDVDVVRDVFLPEGFILLKKLDT